MKAGVLLVTAFVVAVVGFIGTVFFVGSAGANGAAGCGSQTATVTASTEPVGRWQIPQLEIAAIVINAGAEMKLSARAQTIGVMTAMGESSLQNLGYGDEGQGVTNPGGSPTTSKGVFQQQESWGPARLDPRGASLMFFERLVKVDGWESMEPTLAAHAVQINADPFHYAPFWDDAQKVVNALAGAGGSCAVGADAQALAVELMTAVAAGKLRGSTPDHIIEIQNIAEGKTVPDCGIDVRILQVLVLTVRNFDNVAVSDINRKCTNQIEGAGVNSSHYIDGGGHAIDLWNLNGEYLDGTDANTLKLISILGPVMPQGSGLGQSNCRASAGIQVPLGNFTEFPDSCNHMHIDVGRADGPLAF